MTQQSLSHKKNENCESHANPRHPVENLMALSPDELDQNMISLAQQERKLLAEVLLTLREIDRRRLYLKLAYGSLFDYLTKHIGYSAGSAQRRIDAARLMGEVPEVKTKIEQGKINLTQLSLMQRAVRQVKLSGKSVTRELKQELLTCLETKTQTESEVLVAQSLDLPRIEKTIQKTQKDESVRLEITLTKKQFELLEQARAIVSHAVPSGDLAKVIEYLATQVIAKKGDNTTWESQRESRTHFAATLAVNSQELPPHLRPMPVARKPIPASIKKRIFARDTRCTHVDHKTGRLCGSTWQLELDHIQPLYAGGGNAAENLRILCRRHNQSRNQNRALT